MSTSHAVDGVLHPQSTPSRLLADDSDSDESLELIMTHLIYFEKALVSTADMAVAMGGETHAPVVVSLSPFVVLDVPVGQNWFCDVAYGLIPAAPLVSNPAVTMAPVAPWYTVTKGLWVGIFSMLTMASDVIDGVSGNAWKSFKSRHAALLHFNNTLTLGLVAIKTQKKKPKA
ncbi:hypothetical protein C8J56DRAFT_900302 [Mycena floridula]|nr:hypothetical protein C8J56DRAFT_900302 [Mycena floridula]